MPEALAERLAAAARLRNLLVHRYRVRDDRRLYEAARRGLRDFEEYAAIIPGRSQRSPGGRGEEGGLKLEQRLHRMPRGERLRLVKKLRGLLAGDERVVFAYLYGSFLTGEAFRDLDVAVWLRPGVDPLEYVLREGLRLEEQLGLPVDITVLNSAPPALRHRVYTTGIPLVVRDPLLHGLETAAAALMVMELRQLRRWGAGDP